MVLTRKDRNSKENPSGSYLRFCFEYTILFKSALGGVGDVALFSISHEQTHYSRVRYIHSLYDFFASKGSPFLEFIQFNIFTAAGVKCCVAALKVCPYFIIVQIILFGPLESMSACLLVLNIQYCLSRRWGGGGGGGVRDVALFSISHEQTQ